MSTNATTSNLNLPNTITVSRILMAVVTFWLMMQGTLLHTIGAGVLFTIAALTDLLDGKLARDYGIITNFGKIVDPIADKLLVLGAFYMLTRGEFFSVWWIVPILIREISITLLRFYFMAQGVVVASVKSGKRKTFLQIVSLGLIYFNLLYQNFIIQNVASPNAETISTVMTTLMYAGLIAAVAMTIYSGYDFWRLNKNLILGQRSS